MMMTLLTSLWVMWVLAFVFYVVMTAITVNNIMKNWNKRTLQKSIDRYLKHPSTFTKRR